jgi:gluconate kinase
MEGKVCVLVMGVSGCGKSSVASALQAKLDENVTFLDADAFHPPENVAKMKNGMLKNLFSGWNSKSEQLTSILYIAPQAFP